MIEKKLTHTKHQSHHKGNAAVTTIGIVAVVALIVGWIAFNRSGEDLLPTVADEADQAYEASVDATNEAADEVVEATSEVTTEAQLLAARTEARAELAAIEARLEAGEAYEDVAADINEVEADLEAAYANASMEAQQEYQELANNLGELEDAAREGTGDVLDQLANLLLLLEADVRTDETE